MTGTAATPAGGRGYLRRLLRVDRSELALGRGLRCAIGVVVALSAGIAAGATADGVSAAVGALSVGISSLQGAYRRRALVMTAASIGMALSAFVGAAAAGVPALSVAMVGIWGVLAGWLVALGPAATVVGLQCGVALIVFGQYPMTPGQAAVRALLVLAGGAGQTVLAVLFWPLRLHLPERGALADVFDALAGYAAGAAGGAVGPPAAEPFTRAAAVLADVNPLEPGRNRLPFRSLLDEAERLRTQLAAVAHARGAAGAQEADGLTRALRASARRLAAVADRLRPTLTGSVAAERLASRLPTLASLPGLPGGAGPAPPAGDHDTDARAVPALAGQLRAVERLAAGLVAGERPGAADPGERLVRLPTADVRGALLTLRANLGLESEAFRHALRLGVVLSAAAVLYRILPLQRGYWIALTALVVLKPDFATTVLFGVGRIVGTAAGAAAATALAAQLRPGPALLVALVGVLVTAGVGLLRVNYTVFAFFLTCYVVFLLGLVGLPPQGAAVDRLIDTAVGGGLALAAYLVWPTWEGRRTGAKLADLVQAQRRYAVAVLRAYARPGESDPRRLHASQLEARRARLAAEASVDRLLAEPRSERFDPGLATGVVAAARRFAQAALSLHAALPEEAGPAGPAGPAVDALADRLDTVLVELAVDLRLGRVPAPPPADLRAAHDELEAALGDSGAGRLLAAATDEMVDAADTVRELVAGRAGAPVAVDR